MITKEVMGWISLVIAVISYVPYIISMIRGKTKPHAFSWIIWGTITGIVYFAQTAGHGGPGAWAAGVSSLFCLSISIMALKWGEKKITRGDWITFLIALTAIPLWIITKDPWGAVVLVRAIDCVAYYPTLRKSWNKPHEELAFKYALTISKYSLSLLALQNFTFINALYPVVDIIMDSTLITVLILRRRALSRLGVAPSECNRLN